MKTVHTTFGTIATALPLRQLGDFVFFQEGPGLRKWQWRDSGMKVINVTNILSDGSVDISNTTRHISESEFSEKYQHFAIDDGDIVIASSGNTYGKVGRINSAMLPLMMNTSVIRFRPIDASLLDADYLYAFLRSHLFRNQVESFVIGSAQPNFGPTHLKLMKIPVPPFDVQEQVGRLIAVYDNLLENNTRRIRLLEQMAQLIYQEWFVDFRFPGHEDVEMVVSELGPVPEGWRTSSISAAVELNPRLSPAKGQEKVYVPMAGLNTDSMLVTEFETRTSNSGSKFQNNDTLFARITPSIEHGKTGFVQFLSSDSEVAVGSTEFIVMRSRTLNSYFVYGLARVPELRQHAINSMSGASGRQRVQMQCFDNYFFAHPTHDILEKFANLAAPIFRSIHTLNQKNQNLRQTRDMLLPKLISGELDVSELAEVAETEEAA